MLGMALVDCRCLAIAKRLELLDILELIWMDFAIPRSWTFEALQGLQM